MRAADAKQDFARLTHSVRRHKPPLRSVHKMETISALHQVAAVYAFIIGAVVLRNRKGTVLHTWLGRSFVASMVVTDLSAFALMPEYGFTWFHALAVWNLIYITLGLWYALRRPSHAWIVHHFYYFSYAYLGVLAAAVARVPLVIVNDITVSAIVAISIIFGVGVVLIERTGKRLKSRYASHAPKNAA